jgi:hypothetical protein
MASIPLLRRPLRRRKLRPATVKLRLAATLINLLATLAALALTLGAGVLAYRRFRKRRSEPERPLHAVPDDRGAEPTRTRQWPDGQRFADALQARPVKLGLRMLALVLTLRRAESRSLGFRLLGLRLVDAHSGGEPSRRQRLVREIAPRLWQALHQRLLPVRTPSASPAQERVRDEIAAAHSAHADDQAALQQAVMQVYRDNRVDARVSCLPVLARLPLIAAINIPMPWSALAQSPVDWLSGTVVVDRRHRPRPRRRERRSIKRA